MCIYIYIYQDLQYILMVSSYRFRPVSEHDRLTHWLPCDGEAMDIFPDILWMGLTENLGLSWRFSLKHPQTKTENVLLNVYIYIHIAEGNYANRTCTGGFIKCNTQNCMK